MNEDASIQGLLKETKYNTKTNLTKRTWIYFRLTVWNLVQNIQIDDFNRMNVNEGQRDYSQAEYVIVQRVTNMSIHF